MADQGKRLLMFAPYFPPRRRVGSIRSYRFATALCSMGWKVKVICLATPKGQLTEREKSSLNDIQIYEISSPLDRTTSVPLRPESGREIKKEPKISTWIDKQFPIDTWLPLFQLYKSRIIEEIIKFDPDVIWSTSDPWSSNLTMADITQRLNIPWVADQRDPWTLCDVRFKENGALARYAAKRAERKIMNAADHIVFTAEETTKKYKNTYPQITDRVSTIYNSFDPDLISIHDKEQNKDHFELLFLGRFRPLSSAEAVTEVARKLKQKDPGLAAKLRIVSYGALSSEDQKRIRSAGLHSMFEVRERVPNEAVPGEIAGADMLLLSTEMQRNDIIPAKLIDYLPYNKPVLSLNESPEVKKILLSSGRGVQYGRNNFDEAAEFLAHAIRRHEEGSWPGSDFEADRAVIRAFEITHTSRQLEKILLSVSKHG